MRKLWILACMIAALVGSGNALAYTDPGGGGGALGVYGTCSTPGTYMYVSRWYGTSLYICGNDRVWHFVQ